MESSGGSCFGRYLLIASLPFLFIAFLGVNYYGLLNLLNINTHTFYIVSVIFIIFLLFISHNAFVTVCKIKSQFSVTRNELEKNLEKTSLTIEGKTKSVLSVRDFLEEYFKNIRNDNFTKIASSTFPMLGILGTFIAIAISMPDFTVSNSKELDREISNLLAGVGTAFYASIFGIFLSLWWTFFERVGLSSIEHLTLSLEDIYAKYIWSQKELLKFQYNQKTAFENEFIRALKDTLNLDFIKEINKEHLNSYEKIIELSKIGLNDIENSLKNSSKELISSIEKLRFTKESIDAQDSLERNLKEFNRSAKELKNLLESFDNGLDNALIKIDKELAQSVEHISKIVQLIKE